MYDVIIIGAGPAGLTAALYAGRYRLHTLILEKMSTGGQIVFSPTIENFPGFPGGIETFDLIEKIKQQVEDLGVEFKMEEALEVIETAKQRVWSVKTANNTYEARAVIIATGASPKRLGVKNEDILTGRGVSYCGTCDGPLFKDKEVVVVGGGDRAIEEALFLTRYASKVHLIHRRDAFRASAILVERVRNERKIQCILESIVEEIVGKDRVDGVVIKNVKSGQQTTLPCSGIFVFVGIEPNTAFLKTLLQMDENGFIIANQTMGASKEGIFACGDCCRKEFRQVITACGDGAVAAYSVKNYLDSLLKR